MQPVSHCLRPFLLKILGRLLCSARFLACCIVLMNRLSELWNACVLPSMRYHKHGYQIQFKVDFLEVSVSAFVASSRRLQKLRSDRYRINERDAGFLEMIRQEWVIHNDNGMNDLPSNTESDASSYLFIRQPLLRGSMHHSLHLLAVHRPGLR